MDNQEILKRLIEYYDNNCKKLVFIGEQKLLSNNNCKMYFCDVQEDIELCNYKKVFQEYLFLYVRNRDYLYLFNKRIKNKTDSELSSILLQLGYPIASDQGIYPRSNGNINNNGIYGELFDDFYLNIVKKEEILLIYANKKQFGNPNQHGIDVIAANVIDDKFYLIFSEAKFVESIYSASSSLCSDISGNNGHVSEEYINEYISFIIDRRHSVYYDDKKSKVINNVMNELNRLITVENIKTINAINHLNITVRFDFFAIYSDNKYQIEDRKNYFENIVNEFDREIKKTGINKYDMEIVFIPTRNKSTKLKGEMEKWN